MTFDSFEMQILKRVLILSNVLINLMPKWLITFTERELSMVRFNSKTRSFKMLSRRLTRDSWYNLYVDVSVDRVIYKFVQVLVINDRLPKIGIGPPFYFGGDVLWRINNGSAK